jgi:hypothetical protein
MKAEIEDIDRLLKLLQGELCRRLGAFARQFEPRAGVQTQQ